jgi:succinoglycan biosynthesis protein ExoM
VVVAVCSYDRNDPLARLLQALAAVAGHSRAEATMGVVVVDDNPDGSARPVAERYRERFELGLHYRTSGRRNISLARNLAVQTAAELGDWVAMTDDDCEPIPEWISELLAVQARFDADAVTGPLQLRAPPGAPCWLTEQPFFEDGLTRYTRDELVQIAATHNSLLRSSWWREHAELRFREDLGSLGGEDVVFYRSAARAGLRIASAHRALVHGNEPVDRTTFRYLSRYRFWLGNTSCVTRRELGDAGRIRLLLSGVNALRRAVQRPLVRLVHGQAPQWRYAFTSMLSAIGTVVGALGVEVRHP